MYGLPNSNNLPTLPSCKLKKQLYNIVYEEYIEQVELTLGFISLGDCYLEIHIARDSDIQILFWLVKFK